MQSPIFWLASLAAFATFCVHTFVGGRHVAQPLLADVGLPTATKWLAYYCWHLVTLMLMAITLFFAAAASFGMTTAPLLAMSLFCLSCGALSIAIAIKGKIAPWRFPSTWLFTLIGLIGISGVAI